MLEPGLRARMECAALRSPLITQSRRTSSEFGLGERWVRPLFHLSISPADLAGNPKLHSRRWGVDVGIAYASFKLGFHPIVSCRLVRPLPCRAEADADKIHFLREQTRLCVRVCWLAQTRQRWRGCRPWTNNRDNNLFLTHAKAARLVCVYGTVVREMSEASRLVP